MPAKKAIKKKITKTKKPVLKKTSPKKAPAKKKTQVKKVVKKKVVAKIANDKSKIAPYKPKKNEKYMSAAMKKHFIAVLLLSIMNQ